MTMDTDRSIPSAIHNGVLDADSACQLLAHLGPRDYSAKQREADVQRTYRRALLGSGTNAASTKLT